MCSYTITPSEQTFLKEGGSGEFTVTTENGCPWSIVSNSPWVSVATGMEHKGSATVLFDVAAAADDNFRIGTLSLKEEQFIIRQNVQEKKSICPAIFFLLNSE